MIWLFGCNKKLTMDKKFIIYNNNNNNNENIISLLVINLYNVKLRMAHYISYNLFDQL
jgi:hypothetical protein